MALRGVSGTQGRIEITLSSPFPGGDRAVADTRVAPDIRAREGALHLAISQETQGVTSFRSLTARGSRPTAVNVVIYLPRNGSYDVHLVANHQRMAVHDLEIRGVLEGYGSPGADIDAMVVGPLRLEVDGVTYRSKVAGDDASRVRGGTTARLRAPQSSNVEFKANQAPLDLVMVGSEAALDITATGIGDKTIDVGPTEGSSREGTSARARTADFSRAAIQVVGTRLERERTRQREASLALMRASVIVRLGWMSAATASPRASRRRTAHPGRADRSPYATGSKDGRGRPQHLAGANAFHFGAQEPAAAILTVRTSRGDE